MKASISLPGEIAELLEQRATPGYGAISGTIQRIIDRYAECCRRSLPELSRDQWCAVLSAVDSAPPDPAHSVAWAIHIVEDALRDGHADGWRIDGDELLAAMREWTHAERMAAVDMAEQRQSAIMRGEKFEVPGRNGGRQT